MDRDTKSLNIDAKRISSDPNDSQNFEDNVNEEKLRMSILDFEKKHSDIQYEMILEEPNLVLNNILNGTRHDVIRY